MPQCGHAQVFPARISLCWSMPQGLVTSYQSNHDSLPPPFLVGSERTELVSLGALQTRGHGCVLSNSNTPSS